MDELRIAARRAVLAYQECGSTMSAELVDSMKDLCDWLDANPPLKSYPSVTTPPGVPCGESAQASGGEPVEARQPHDSGGELPGPELGPHDRLPCDVTCEGFGTFHKGVKLGTLLGYLARRVMYNNAETLNERRGGIGRRDPVTGFYEAGIEEIFAGGPTCRKEIDRIVAGATLKTEAPERVNGFAPIVTMPADDGDGRKSALNTTWPDMHERN